MPRKYVPKPGAKRYKTYSDDIIKQACKELAKDPTKSISAVAKKHNISKSALHRYNCRIMKKLGGQKVLSDEMELEIIRYLNVCAKWGYPMDTYDLRSIVKMYLDKMGIQRNRFKNNMPGKDFVKSFMRRHKDVISQRLQENIYLNRPAFTADVVREYFNRLEQSLAGVPPQNIINYDEINLAINPGRKKAIVKRREKYPERIVKHPKSAISIMITASAAGDLLPPYVVYNSQNIYDTWVYGAPKGTRFNRTKSGWFDGIMFDDFIKTMIIPYFKDKEGPKLLIGDNLSSHLSVEVIKMCQADNISFIFLPANSAHLMQPLDVAFSQLMRDSWRDILMTWKISTEGQSRATLPKGCFPKMLKKLMVNLSENADDNIKSGFRKSGIVPFDVTQVLSRLLKAQEGNPDNAEEAVEKSVLDLLKEKGSVARPCRKRRRTGPVSSIDVKQPKINKTVTKDENLKERNENIIDTKAARNNNKSEAVPGRETFQNEAPKMAKVIRTYQNKNILQKQKYKVVAMKYDTVDVVADMARRYSEDVSQNQEDNPPNVRNQVALLVVFEEEDSQTEVSHYENNLASDQNVEEVEIGRSRY